MLSFGLHYGEHSTVLQYRKETFGGTYSMVGGLEIINYSSMAGLLCPEDKVIQSRSGTVGIYFIAAQRLSYRIKCEQEAQQATSSSENKGQQLNFYVNSEGTW